MRRRDFVKGIVAAPMAAKTLLGQQSGTGQASEVPQKPEPMVEPGSKTPKGPLAPALGSREPAVVPSLSFNGSGSNWAVPDAFAETEAHFFNAEQLAALQKLSDLMMPPLNGYPGATQTGAPEFIDFLIGASPAEQQELYQSGLDRLNKEARKQFGVPFAQLGAAQADTLLRPHLVTWMTDHPPAEPFTRFVNIAHHDIRTATMNSQVWSIAATASGERAPGVGLYWAPIDPDIDKYV